MVAITAWALRRRIRMESTKLKQDAVSRGGHWWYPKADGSWLRWNAAMAQWEETDYPPPPPEENVEDPSGEDAAGKQSERELTASAEDRINDAYLDGRLYGPADASIIDSYKAPLASVLDVTDLIRGMIPASHERFGEGLLVVTSSRVLFLTAPSGAEHVVMQRDEVSIQVVQFGYSTFQTEMGSSTGRITSVRVSRETAVEFAAQFEGGGTRPSRPLAAPDRGIAVMHPGTSTSTNGMAIASLICGLLFFGGIGSILALIFGYQAKNEIRASQGIQGGDGMATAGIVLGWIGLVGIILIAVLFLGGSTSPY